MLRDQDIYRNFPTGAQADLLQVITSENVAQTWAAWQESYSLQDVEIYRLVPALYFRLQEAGVEGGSYLRGVVRHCYAASAIQQQVAAEMVAELASIGIDTLALKGLAMSLHLGYAPRHMSDIDLLIPFDRIDDAVDLVLGAGWVPDFEVNALDLKKANHVAHGWGFSRGPLKFDLHWRAVHQDQSSTFDGYMWGSAIQKGVFRVPSKTLLIFQILLHGIRQFAKALVWPADIYSMLKVPGDIEWDLLFRLAEERRLLVPFFVLIEALRPYMPVPPRPNLQVVTQLEADEHRGLTTREPSEAEERAIKAMMNYRKKNEGRIVPPSFFRMHRRPPTIE
jgi:hypothetical protein